MVGGVGLELEGPSKDASMWWRDLKLICRGNNQSLWFDYIVKWRIDDRGTFKFWSVEGRGCKYFLGLFLNSNKNNKLLQIWDFGWMMFGCEILFGKEVCLNGNIAW